MIGGEQAGLTGAAGKKDSGRDRLKQVGLFAILGFGHRRQMGGDEFGAGHVPIGSTWCRRTGQLQGEGIRKAANE